nr:hypothetical protein [Tanacetum cinerariifolium]
MTYFVESMTLDSVKSSVMQDASCIQRKVFMETFVLSIPFVLSRDGSISPDSFLPPILLLVVIIVTFVIVAVILVVVVAATIRVIIFVTIIGVVVVVGVSAIIKLSFVIIGFEAVTFPLILLGNPPMKTSISFLVFGTKFGRDLDGLLYSNRFVIGIIPRQGILGESTRSKFHFAVLGIQEFPGSGFQFVLSVFAMLAACASSAATTRSSISFWMAA